MAEPDHRPGTPREIHIDKNQQPGWFKALAWLALALGVLALILALSRCNRQDPVTPAAPVAAPTEVPAAPPKVIAETADAPKSGALAGTSGLGAFLGGTEAAPRKFTFEKLNFDTAKSEVRAADADEVDQVATTLKQYPAAHIQIAGYADARGNEASNIALGKARAESVKAALVAKGIGAERIDTVSGGANDPVDTNATSSGRFENRRTELVVTAR